MDASTTKGLRSFLLCGLLVQNWVSSSSCQRYRLVGRVVRLPPPQRQIRVRFPLWSWVFARSGHATVMGLCQVGSCHCHGSLPGRVMPLTWVFARSGHATVMGLCQVGLCHCHGSLPGRVMPLTWVFARSGHAIGMGLCQVGSCHWHGSLPGRVMPLTWQLAPQWLPCQAPGGIGSALGLVGPVSVYCDGVR